MSVRLYLQQCVAYQVKCDQQLEDMGDKLALAVRLIRNTEFTYHMKHLVSVRASC